MNTQCTIDQVVNSACIRIGKFVSESVTRLQDVKRISQSLKALIDAGVSLRNDQFYSTVNCLLDKQQEDEGWISVEETAWSISVLKYVPQKEEDAIKRGCEYLEKTRHVAGGWGQTERDIPRIPTTALVCELVPELADRRAINWISQEWKKDLESPVKLSYKAGFFLLAAGNKKEWIDSDLVEKTVEYLSQDQNDDGGFAPWKNHPIGSDPWSTGVVLWGLSKWGDRVDKQIFEKALTWLKESQLPSGVWPYHYLDDGASMAVLGIIGAQKALGGTI
ncbi:terpene cyclase/mutase family protein [Candidatus Pacearchaeota archaeon]|nr:terpene cyclase/mutase family protein [Candidatus Pacearchaeota archaeon]